MPFSDQGLDMSGIKARLLNLIENLSDDSLLILLKKAEGLPSKGIRKHLRKFSPINVNFIVQDQEFKGIAQNISYSGVFIETSGTFSMGSKVSLSFVLNGIQNPIKITAEVVRISSRGIGVKFKNLIKQQEKMIKFLVDSG